MKTDTALTGGLHRLAGLYNIQTAYYDTARRRRMASADSLLAVLKALGVPGASLREVPSLLRERRQALRRCLVEPVTLAWDGARPRIRLCLPAKLAGAGLTGHLETEDGGQRQWQWDAAALPVLEKANTEGTDYLVKQLELPEGLPFGYHRCGVEVAGQRAETLIISAPVRAYQPPGGERAWGVFAPLYALRARETDTSGDYTALGRLAEEVGEMGGRTVATLPLLPSFLDEPYEPSPYAPVSRLLWNEFYIDMESVPEMAAVPGARPGPEAAELRAMPLVDYRRIMAAKRRALEACLRQMLKENTGRSQEFREFVRDNPVVEDYARFRAAMEKQRAPWPSWPQPQRDGALDEGDYDAAARDYHLYAQWLAHRQVQALADSARRRDVTLYFDLPLGTHPAGYDTWRERRRFALEATAGAPPDTVFTWGQDWRFPPPHPEAIRTQGYRHFIAYIRHHLRHAGMLRIDHVMGLHRLFWIPQGADARHGVYVRYRAEELYAILALESHRHHCAVVGEDLGTVPACVRPAMARHGLQRLYVLHYELAGSASGTPRRPPPDAVASLNTHDMPPFAAFWQGSDIAERRGLGLLDGEGARAEKKARRALTAALGAFLRRKGWLPGRGEAVLDAFRACLYFLSASRARVVLVNLEDLWLETQSQNVPATGDRYPSWQRKARYALAGLGGLPGVRDTLEAVDRLRKKGTK